MHKRNCERAGPTGPAAAGGFTLVELLVVLAILGALAALLFPALAAARASAHASVCISNLRQIGQAAQIYVDDWDGAYPFAFSPRFRAEVVLGQSDDPHGAVARQPDYTQVLQPYLKSRNVLRCPADAGIELPNGGHDVLYPPNAFAAWGTSYDYSADVAEAYFGLPPFGGSGPQIPAQTPLFEDSSYLWHGDVAEPSDLPGARQVVYADLHAGREASEPLLMEISEAYVDPLDHQ